MADLPSPGFPVRLAAPADFMRLSLMKAAHAVASRAAYWKFRVPQSTGTRQPPGTLASIIENAIAPKSSQVFFALAITIFRKIAIEMQRFCARMEQRAPVQPPRTFYP
jgi:hypothetical protein